MIVYGGGWHPGQCPGSPIRRERALRVVEQVGRGCRDRPVPALWRVHNGGGRHDHCHRGTSADAFRAWSCERCQSLNEAWGTASWCQCRSGREQILPPRAFLGPVNPGRVRAFRRFGFDAPLDLYRAGRDLLTELAPATTDLMVGAHRDMDHRSFAEEPAKVSGRPWRDCMAYLARGACAGVGRPRVAAGDAGIIREN